MKRIAWPLALLFLVVSALNAQTFRMYGSDFFDEVLKEPAQKFADSIEFSLDYRMHGSVLAYSQLRDGEADIAIIAVPEMAELPSFDYEAIPFAYSAAAVIVNLDNPLQEITIEQLGGIYSEGQKLDIKEWGGMGLTSLWRTRTILPYAVSREDAVALELFKYMAMPDSNFRTKVTFIEKDMDVITKVEQDGGAIGLIMSRDVGTRAKILAVAKGSGGQGNYAYHPTAENINFGDYPLRLKYFVLYNKNSPAMYKPFLQQLYSEEMSQRLIEYGFVPLPENDRKRYALELDALE